MPLSFKLEGDDRIVIDNQTGEPIPHVIRAQTSAITGSTYTVARRGLFGRVIEKAVSADIRFVRAYHEGAEGP